MTDKIQMTSIHLVIGWGLTEYCGREATVHSWDEATSQLRKWNALPGAGLQGVDYVVTFEDGFTHTGTVQLYGESAVDPFNRTLAAGLHRRMELTKGSFLDKSGERKLSAILIGARYDYGCDTSEPAVANRNNLLPYLEANAGKDVEVTVVGREDTLALIFDDGDQLLAASRDEADYLVRQWRIMNNIHPFLGGETPLIEPAPAKANSI